MENWDKERCRVRAQTDQQMFNVTDDVKEIRSGFLSEAEL